MVVYNKKTTQEKTIFQISIDENLKPKKYQCFYCFYELNGKT